MKNTVEAIVVDSRGRVKSRSVINNLRTNVGAAWCFSQLFSFSQLFGATPPGAAIFMGLTTDTNAPLVTDTALLSEQTANGLNRVQALPAYSAGAGSVVLSNTFLYTGSAPITIAKAGLFTLISGGELVNETLLTPAVVLNNGDQLVLNWTVNF